MHMSIHDVIETGNMREIYKDDFKQHFLIDLHELLIPVVNVGGLLIARVILFFLNRVIFVMICPFKNLKTQS
jgi:hypothetical protein